MEIENSDGDTLCADERMASDELATAQQHQDRLQEELENYSRESLDIAVLDVEEAASKLKDCRNLHDTVCRGLEDAGETTIELKRRRTMPMTGPDPPGIAVGERQRISCQLKKN